MKLVADARAVDDNCFYIVHDVRVARRADRTSFKDQRKIAA